MPYKHTQLATALLIVLAIVSLFLCSILLTVPSTNAGYPLAFITLVAFIFSSLTIHVNNDRISWFFGPLKFWHKSVDLSEVDSLRYIATKWYYGLGIRMTSTGWLYNVSGLTAVEITLNNGRTISLGTNDADGLMEAIKQGLSNR